MSEDLFDQCLNDGIAYERERIRKIALEPSEEMRDRLSSVIIDFEMSWPSVRAVLRAFAEEIGR